MLFIAAMTNVTTKETDSPSYYVGLVSEKRKGTDEGQLSFHRITFCSSDLHGRSAAVVTRAACADGVPG